MNVNHSKHTSIQRDAIITSGDYTDTDSVLMVNGQRVAGTTAPLHFNSTDGTPITLANSATIASGPVVNYSGRQRGSTQGQPGTNSPCGIPIYNSAGKVIRIKHGPGWQGPHASFTGTPAFDSSGRPTQAKQGYPNQAQRK
ncbi:hypothetical protein CC1G_02161 [Coprinopsis cinerea okayama7|uniref:Uncharacterized protein n=1 Tax=Coprinopsis cinerea (strain Okayama-7 / 130 / ATCC MYA-4618 / FGSC 9003) TaxID=240176 RepID=A8NKE4_COPC7|nr:hypothetical protein CC1G_02161 [Coprinopsis cinerea okayama7\|eukprot:XP_001834425.1 hypothetical protein CC1G_02161 [Coprinopsis cinerea okayama7\